MTEISGPMDILKLLDKSNCRKCNKPTCLAFAAAVFKGEKELEECPNLDSEIIGSYLNLRGGSERSNGRYKTIAVNPAWNSERIILQKVTFTLHGNKKFALDCNQAPSLVAIPVPAKSKPKLMYELERIGINEMAIFPEIEHTCGYLRRKIKS